MRGATIVRLLQQTRRQRGGLRGRLDTLLGPTTQAQFTPARNYISDDFIVRSEFPGLSLYKFCRNLPVKSIDVSLTVTYSVTLIRLVPDYLIRYRIALMGHIRRCTMMYIATYNVWY